ncbi:GFA family protein [Pseudomonas gelidaquae]|uniref:GFA family protein n=1 Tax=Pseudomonas sp. IB20 TaxID=1702250 RepID=UPI0012D3530F|nr:GFA family protein [Pseudomonas sp. IB20]
MDAVTQGSCLCGAINYQVSTRLKAVTHTRQFCSRCGSSLFWSDANGLYRGWVSIALGTLDTPFVARNQAHSCLESKAAWFCEDSV